MKVARTGALKWVNINDFSQEGRQDGDEKAPARIFRSHRGRPEEAGGVGPAEREVPALCAVDGGLKLNEPRRH